METRETTARKFVAWRRVSTKMQGRSGLGLEAQKDIIDYFVKMEQGELVADYVDVHSGKDLYGCTNLMKAIAKAKEEGATLVIAKADRFRNVKEALDIYDKMNGSIMFCDIPNTDRFTITLFFAFAERERLLIGLRTKQALKALKEQGKQLGAAKGVDRFATVRGKALEARKENRDNNPNNKRAFNFAEALREQGKSYKEIADKLNEGGFTTAKGGQWRGNQVSRLLASFGK